MEIYVGIIGHRVDESGNAKLMRSTAGTRANTCDAQHKGHGLSHLPTPEDRCGAIGPWARSRYRCLYV